MEYREFRTVQEIDQAIADGFKIKKLTFTVNNPEIATEFFDHTIRQYAVQTAQSNACMNQAYITLEDNPTDRPDIMVAIFFLNDVIEIARKHMDQISNEIDEMDRECCDHFTAYNGEDIEKRLHYCRVGRRMVRACRKANPPCSDYTCNGPKVVGNGESNI